MKNFHEKLEQATQKIRDAETEEAKQSATEAWWQLAIDEYNDTIAGDVQLADGRIMSIPEIK